MGHECQCAACREPGASITREKHAQLNTFLSGLDGERQMQFLGLESINPAHGSDEELAQITGISAAAIAKSRWQIQYRWLADMRSAHWRQFVYRENNHENAKGRSHEKGT